MTAPATTDFLGLRHGDNLTTLRGLPDECVNLTITSPPYWCQRSYNAGEQEHGSEDSLEAYIARQVEVFREVRRVTRHDGLLFLNLGDKYAGSGGAGGDYAEGGLREGQPRQETRPSFRRDKAETGPEVAAAGLAAKNLIGLPWRVAFALQADGWVLRSAITWVKGLSFLRGFAGSVMPESAADRPTSASEMVFMLAKSPRYYYDGESEREVGSATSHGGGSEETRRSYLKGAGRNDSDGCLATPSPTRNLRNAWYEPPLDVFCIQPEPLTWQICTTCMTVYDGAEMRRRPLDSEKRRVCRCGRADSWTSHFAGSAA